MLKRIQKLLLTFILLEIFFISNLTVNAVNKVDSLRVVLKTATDTNRLFTLNRLAQELYESGGMKDAYKHTTEALELSIRLNNEEGEIFSLINKGLYHYAIDQYDEALKINRKILDLIGSNDKYNKYKLVVLKNIADVYLYIEEYQKAIDYYSSANLIAQKRADNSEKGDLYQNMATAYFFMASYPNAIEYYLKALKEKEKQGKKTELAGLYLNVGNVYLYQNDYKNALKYYEDASKISSELGQDVDYSKGLNNIGKVYETQGKLEVALEYFFKSLDIKLKFKQKTDAANTMANIASILTELKRYDEALNYLTQALDIFQKEGSKKGLAFVYTNIGVLYNEKNMSTQAIFYLQKGLTIAKEINDNEMIKNIFERLAETNAKNGNYKSAYDFHREYSAIKDTLLNEENSKAMLELQTKYQTEKQQLAIDNLNKENDLKDERIKKEKLIRYVFVAGFLMVLILTFIVYRGYREKRKANIALEEKNNSIHQQKTIIEKQKSEVEQKNKEITDSINYALRIQNAIIPSDRYMYSLFPESFVFYAPKDIVSGDFYWMAEKNDWQLLAAVDCTGHGVPGALMSMIGHNLLTQIVNERSITDPGDILNNLNLGVRHALKQDTDESNTRDGMDIALCAINRKTNELKFAGANRPLYLFSKGIFSELKPDKFPIGGIQEDGERKYTTHTLQFEKGDVLYVFSDGYVDQFGGHSGKKFMAKQLKEMLASIHVEPVHKQKTIIQNSLISWKGKEEQVDDILLIGIKL